MDNIIVEQDNDGDGEGSISDCNDDDASINSAATEVCDGVDNNCDGNTDDIVLTAPTISPSGIINLCKPDAVNLSVEAVYDSYQWYKNGNIIVGATSNNYNTNKPAYYSVMVTLGDCSATSAVQAVAVTASPLANISVLQILRSSYTTFLENISVVRCKKQIDDSLLCISFTFNHI